MLHIILIVVYLLLGLGLRRFNLVGDRGARWLVSFVVNAALPAMAFVSLRTVHIDSSLLVPISMAWLLFLLGGVLFLLLGTRLGWNRRMIGAVVLTGALGNTSFLGFPILQALIGEAALPIGVVADQLGSFLVLASLATAFAAYCSGEHVQPRVILRRLLIYPPMLAVLLAFSLRDVEIPASLLQLLQLLAACLAPTSLIAVGLSMTLRRADWRRVALPTALGLTFKLAVGPALLALIYLSWHHLSHFPQSAFVMHVTVLEAAMAPMIMGSVLAIQSGQDREIAGAMVMLGIPLSLVTVPLWHLLLKSIL